MTAAVLDFNSSKMRLGAASAALNDVLDAGLQSKRSLQERRAYLGASAIGGDCERSIQFDFAGAPREKGFKPETLRKFDLGHSGEALMRDWFIGAGFDLAQNNQRTGQPFGFAQLDGRFKGHVDGVFLSGPAIPGVGYPALWEAKSVGVKTYRELEKQGLKKARPHYYAQVAIYQAYLNLTDHPAIFTVLNLDSGEILHLLIPFDADEAQRMSDRAVRIIGATDAGELLPRAFNDRNGFGCKFCDFRERCWSLPK